MKRIFLDYASTTPVDPIIEKEINKIQKVFGNPGSLHSFGQEAIEILDNSRIKVANFFDVEPSEVVFVHCATEANNLALRGVVKYCRLNATHKDLHIISTQIEHDSVLNTLKDLEREGVSVTYLPVSRDGRVRASDVESFLKRETILVSIMAVNNETGAIQPIEEIAKIIKNWKRSHNSVFPVFHTDAVQAIQFLDCEIDNLGVDLLSFSGHKIYAPKGGAGLIVKKDTPLEPIITGGEQEFGYWPGTENIFSIFGLAQALELTKESRKAEIKRLNKIREIFFEGIKEIFPNIISNSDFKITVPSILNLRFLKEKSDTFD